MKIETYHDPVTSGLFLLNSQEYYGFKTLRKHSPATLYNICKSSHSPWDSYTVGYTQEVILTLFVNSIMISIDSQNRKNAIALSFCL